MGVTCRHSREALLRQRCQGLAKHQVNLAGREQAGSPPGDHWTGRALEGPVGNALTNLLITQRSNSSHKHSSSYRAHEG
jgi:hypothetical protein